MKKGISSKFLVGLLLIGAFLAIYYLNLSPTGFAIYQQGDCSSFDEGAYQNTVCDDDSSAVILAGNETSGTYTSKIFDASENVSWDNMTWQGSDTLDFEIRNCSTADCSGSSFASADLNDLGLTGQYFQYRVSFDSGVLNGTNETLSLSSISLEYSTVVPANTTLSLSSPSGTISYGSDIPLNFTATGEGLSCWYDVHDSSDDATILENTTISGCSSTTFSPGVGNGNYVLNLYANGSSGFASKSTSFTINPPSNQNTEEPTTSEEPVTEVPVTATEVPVVETPIVVDMAISEVLTSTSLPENSQKVDINAKNIGTEPLSACSLKPQGDLASWISTTEEGVNLNAGDSHTFPVTVSVPKETTDGAKTLSVSVECAEKSVTKDFVVNVESKKLDFIIIDAKRTRSNRVSVTYSVEELTGKDRNVSVYLSILDSSNKELANATDNRTLGANATKEFKVNIPINATIEGNFSLSATVNSEVYRTSVLEPITLGAPISGLATLGNLGSGSIIVIVIVIVVLVLGFIIVRKIRKK